jgi:hypothetical protein
VPDGKGEASPPRRVSPQKVGQESPVEVPTPIEDSSNVEAPFKKANPQQLPLKKHRHASIYYHSAFTTYPRHNRLENLDSNPDVLKTLFEDFSSRARVDNQIVWNSTVASWNTPKKSLFLSLPPLAQASNVGDDGLMSQSLFDVNINDKDKDYLTQIYPNRHLLDSSMPSDDRLRKYYKKLLEAVMLLRKMSSSGKTLSAIRRRGELMDLKISDITAKDVMLDIDDAEFSDLCANNQYA